MADIALSRLRRHARRAGAAAAESRGATFTVLCHAALSRTMRPVYTAGAAAEVRRLIAINDGRTACLVAVEILRQDPADQAVRVLASTVQPGDAVELYPSGSAHGDLLMSPGDYIEASAAADSGVTLLALGS